MHRLVWSFIVRIWLKSVIPTTICSVHIEDFWWHPLLNNRHSIIQYLNVLRTYVNVYDIKRYQITTWLFHKLLYFLCLSSKYFIFRLIYAPRIRNILFVPPRQIYFCELEDAIKCRLVACVTTLTWRHDGWLDYVTRVYLPR